MSYRINITPDTDTLYLILPGASQGAHAPLLKAITDKLETAGKTWLAVTYPFQDKGLNSPESESHEREMQEVLDGLSLLPFSQYEMIVIIGKSFGALVGAKLVSELKKRYRCTIEFHVLGFIFDAHMRSLPDKCESLTVYQGEYDRFGSAAEVAKIFPTAAVFTIVGGDHSYRNANREPVFEDVVVRKLFEVVKI